MCFFQLNPSCLFHLIASVFVFSVKKYCLSFSYSGFRIAKPFKCPSARHESKTINDEMILKLRKLAKSLHTY